MPKCAMMTTVADKRALPGLGVVVAVVVAGLTVFALAVLIGWQTDAPTATVADWVAAIATVAAFGAAVIAAWYAGRALRAEQERDAKRDEAERRSQASLIAAWLDEGMYWTSAREVTARAYDPSREVPPPQDAVAVVPHHTTLVIHNASPLPIYDFTLTLFDEPGPGESELVLAAEHTLGMARAGESVWELTFPREVQDACERRQTSRSDWPPDRVEPLELHIGWKFRDAAGAGWERHPGGKLSEVGPAADGTR